MDSLVSLADTDRANATASWAGTLVLVAAAVESAFRGAFLWVGFVAVVLAAVVLPPVAYRDWTATVPWPHLVIVTGAVVTREFGVAPEFAGYVAVAALAILAVVELATFTAVETTRRFAVVFGVLTTLALQGWVTIVEFHSDRMLGTDFLASQTELQWDFVAVSIIALAIGVASEWYLASTSGNAGRGTPG